MTINLTSNAIEMICNGEKIQGDDIKPVLQVADLKLLSAGQQNSTERYRMLLSDGSNMQQGMLATQMNSLVHSGKLQKGSVVQLSQFVTQIIQNRRIILIIELNVIIEKCDPVGDPKMYGQGGSRDFLVTERKERHHILMTRRLDAMQNHFDARQDRTDANIANLTSMFQSWMKQHAWLIFFPYF